MTSVAPDPPASDFPERPERPAGAAPPTPTGADAWPAWAGPVAVVSALIGSVIAGLLVAVVAEIAGVEVFVEGRDAPRGVVIAGLFAQGAVFIGAAVLFARLSGPVHAADLGLRGTPFWRAVGITIAFYIGFIVVATIWWTLVGSGGDEELLDTLGVRRSTLLLVLGAITVCVLAPIGEEILFRGFMYPALRNGIGVAGGAAATGIAFGLVHGFSSAPENLVPLALLGAAFCLIYQATGSLYPCIALHAINNSIALGEGKDWEWQILPLALGAVAVSLGITMAAARVWRPSAS